MRLALNIGSFTVMIRSTGDTKWINLDIINLSEYAREHGYDFQQCDVRRSLPYANESVDFINASHLLEHLDRRDALFFLRECYRVLKIGGILRIGVPDLRKLIDAYLKGEMNKFYRSVSLDHPAQPEEYLTYSDAHKFWHILTSGHKTVYDYDALKGILEEAGFSNIKEVEYNKELDMFPELSLYVEVIK